ncbi:hypothetical protein Cgig2_002858 [Carnegiea gigantea]|uniref:DC1 domain-containing protein n=1 Tax=Carnegiea gigantea TaxID=171969 RepID=A0A9Q1KLJ9_9CARY|nr:hypothetical protein Cgig2_002858 [Carnegiea gigantea]
MIVEVNLAFVFGTFVTLAFLSVTSDYLEERNRLKKGDEEIEAERYRELQTQGFKVPNEVTHLLHDQHPLALEGGPAFVCNACTKDGPSETPRYTCQNKGCNFILHTACGVSDQVSASWNAKKLEIPKSAHEHSTVNFVQGSYAFTCSHCNNKGTSEDSMLISFLHPNHVLELKTRHHFRWCAICGHRGESNARVYTCEGCNFFVHPECAHCLQCYNHPSHRHTLVFRELPKRPKIRCQVCGKKCKRWNYTCPQCQGVAIHRECIGGRFAASSSGTEETTTSPGAPSTVLDVIGEVATEVAVQGLTGVVLDFLQVEY